MNNIVTQIIESGQFGKELGGMLCAPENADLTVSEIKDKLCHKILDRMAVAVDFSPIVEQIISCGFVLFLLILAFQFLITPR